MLNQLLETIIQILTGWVDKFTSHAQHVEDKLDSLDQTASDIETNTEPISDIKDNTGAVITPIQNIKSNTDSIATSSQTSANNTTAILNNISTLSTNTGRAAAYAQDCANNTLDIKSKVTTIASDTTQLRADSAELNDMSDKIYEAIKWSLVDKVITETVEGTDTVSFDTDLTNDLVSLEVDINATQSGTGEPSPDNVRPITGVTDKSITVNSNNITIALGQTVYGGVIDVVRGKLRVTHQKVTLNGDTPESDLSVTVSEGFTQIGWTPYRTIGKGTEVFKSNIFEDVLSTYKGLYKIWNNRHLTTPVPRIFMGLPNTVTTKTEAAAWFANNPTEVIYELAEPIEVQLTPSQIATIKGINTISTDGPIKATYEESIKHYLDKQDN